VAVLETEDVVAGYTEEIDILHGVDMHVGDEETVCIIGPNGAGKSTLIKAVFGMLTPRRGSIRFRGEDITGREPNELVEEGICYVPQLANVFASMSVIENLELGAWAKTGSIEDSLERVYDLFPVLEGRQGATVGDLSGGQRQMVAMGRALMADPDLILMDEPSAGLAPNLVDQVFENIQRIAATGTPIVLVEQNAKKGLSIADRGYVLDQGEIRFEGAGDDLLDDPQVGQLYLGG
jgi:neutral amino acid transport system ATP-binding protein